MVDLVMGVFSVVDWILGLLLIVVFVSTILRLVRADENNVVVRSLHALVDPMTRKLARRFPKLIMVQNGMMLDLSPTVLLLSIGALKIFLPYVERAIVGAM